MTRRVSCLGQIYENSVDIHGDIEQIYADTESLSEIEMVNGDKSSNNADKNRISSQVEDDDFWPDDEIENFDNNTNKYKSHNDVCTAPLKKSPINENDNDDDGGNDVYNDFWSDDEIEDYISKANDTASQIKADDNHADSQNKAIMTYDYNNDDNRANDTGAQFKVDAYHPDSKNKAAKTHENENDDRDSSKDNNFWSDSEIESYKTHRTTNISLTCENEHLEENILTQHNTIKKQSQETNKQFEIGKEKERSNEPSIRTPDEKKSEIHIPERKNKKLFESAKDNDGVALKIERDIKGTLSLKITFDTVKKTPWISKVIYRQP